MQVVDKDLISIQETRDLLRKAKAAQKKLAQMSQADIDGICEAIKNVALENADRLAKLAVEETGFGVHEDKIIKNYYYFLLNYLREKAFCNQSHLRIHYFIVCI